MEIRENEVYAISDIQKILKVSESTIIRLLKKGTLRGVKVGRQYRVLGGELLRIVSPPLESKKKEIIMKEPV